MSDLSYVSAFITGFESVMYGLNIPAIERMAEELDDLKKRGGRLFVLGLGGSAANASHAVNDFRKLCHIDAQAPTDNVAELTARANDDGWENCLSGWLRVHLNHNDALLVLSVGGSNKLQSTPLFVAMNYAHSLHIPVLSIVGRDGGEAKKLSKVCILIPTTNNGRITPYAEAAQAVVWHCLANHPKLQDEPPTGALQSIAVETVACPPRNTFTGKFTMPPMPHGFDVKPGDRITMTLDNARFEAQVVPPSPDEWKRATQGEWPSEPPRRRAVFLDRDGVLCKMVTTHRIVTDPPTPVMRPPYTLDELELLPGVQDACAKLKAAGYLLICVTNQPDIARGKVSKSKVNLINQALKSTLGLDAVYTCPHDDADRCACRKPKPGLLQQAAINHHIELEHSYMIGDRAVDTQAGCAARCRASFQVGSDRYKSLLDVALAIVGTREVTA